MAHVRTEIRNAVKAILEAAAPPGWTVRKGRGRSVAVEQCPCVILAIPNETDERGSQRKRRDPVLAVTAYVTSAEDGDTACDDAAVWLESALDADPTLGGTTQDATHVQSESNPTRAANCPSGN